MTQLIPCAAPGTLAVITKTPAEFDDWMMDWSSRGLGTDTIASSVWETTDPSLTINGNPASYTTTSTTVWLGAGTLGNPCIITNTITTAGGRTLPASVIVLVEAYKFVRN